MPKLSKYQNTMCAEKDWIQPSQITVHTASHMAGLHKTQNGHAAVTNKERISPNKT